MGLPGNMTTNTPSERTEGVNPYAAGAHGDHLVQGLSHGGIGYAGATTARGDNTAPTGSLPPGKRITGIVLHYKVVGCRSC